MPTVIQLLIKSQWKFECQFAVHNECNSGRTCKMQSVLLYNSV